MSVNSLEFFILIPILLGLFYSVPGKYWQITTITLGSFLFYGWKEPQLVIILLWSIVLNVICSWQIISADGRFRRIFWAVFGISLNLGALIIFKWPEMILTFAGQLLHQNLIELEPSQTIIKLALPIGISFYTLEAIALLSDAMSGKLPSPAKCIKEHFLQTSLFLSFFPHLPGGPISRAQQIISQLECKRFRNIDWESATHYLILGYFLKVFVADNLAADLIPHRMDKVIREGCVVMMVENFVRLFADFAGYSYIALGLAKLFGYSLPSNFNWPLLAQSLSEMCNRWNITLSHWFRDFVYIPLGGGRNGRIRALVNVMIVMLLSGAWHGAQASFILWGACLGIFLCVEKVVGLDSYKSTNPFVHALRSTILLMVLSVVSLLFIVPPNVLMGIVERIWAPKTAITVIFFVVPPIMFMFPVLILHIFAYLKEHYPGRFNIHPMVRQLALSIMLFLTIVSPGEPTPFKYFRQ